MLAALGGVLLALPASRLHDADAARARGPARWLLNALRAVPELVWAALLLIAAGLGPFAGTLATSGAARRHRVVTDSVHQAGGKIALQILHTGRYAYSPFAVAPTRLKSPISRPSAIAHSRSRTVTGKLDTRPSGTP